VSSTYFDGLHKCISFAIVFYENFIARELRAPRYYVFWLHWKGSNRVCANHYRTSFSARSISLWKI